MKVHVHIMKALLLMRAVYGHLPDKIPPRQKSLLDNNMCTM